MARHEAVSISLGELKDGVQYYVVKLHSPPDLNISAIARYNDFLAFHNSLPHKHAISSPFPRKKGLFSSGTKEDHIEKRRKQLEQWVAEVLLSNRRELLEFAKAKLQQYGRPIDSRELFNAGTKPWPLYVDGFAYDPLAKNWAQFVLRNSGTYYHKRCFFDLSTSVLIVSYLPWGQTTQLADMNKLRIFPESGSFPYRLAFTGHLVWVYRLGVLASFDLLTNEWETVQHMPQNLVKAITVEMEQNRKEVVVTSDSYMGSVGHYIHLLNATGHHFYDSNAKLWGSLPKCDLKNFEFTSQSGYFWIHAREYVYLFVKCNTTVFPRYNLLQKTWDTCPNPSTDLVVNCAWDHHDKIYLWTTQSAYVHSVEKGTWNEEQHLFLKQVSVAYCTDDFHTDWEEDVALRTGICLEKTLESWEDMYKHNRITKEECEFMEQMESLSIYDKLTHFRNHKEFALATFKSPVINNNDHAFHLALQIAKEDHNLGAELSKLFHFYVTSESGEPKYFPASAEAVQKMMESGNKSHLYGAFDSSSRHPSWG